MNCPFCKIVSGELPSYKVFENEKFVAFLSIRPVTEGHVLVIPKKHIQWVWDVPEIDEYYKISRKIANALRKAYGTQQILSYVIGEEIPHAHVWLLPKTKNDNLENLMCVGKTHEYSTEKMNEIKDKIRQHL